VILSAFLAETIAQRLSTSDGRKAPGEEES
jgi:regulator of extracellular matrix RemA (YlzA/DUF370 family)